MSLSLIQLAAAAKNASRYLSNLSGEQRKNLIIDTANQLRAEKSSILQANYLDCSLAKQSGLSDTLRSRLTLDDSKLDAAIDSMSAVASLIDPLGAKQIHRELDDGLILQRVSCSIGVIGVIFEARPDALIQIAALMLKSGNSALLKGGQEAKHTFQAIVSSLHKTLTNHQIDTATLGHLSSRSDVEELLTLDQYVDLIIPRGSGSFVRYVQEHTKIPVLGHADGLCHLYIDAEADLEMALAVTLDSKTDYPAACNAIETLLIHADIAHQILPSLAKHLRESGVELRGDDAACSILKMNRATDTDWSTEYGDLILAIKIVPSVTAAIDHIAMFGSQHTEAIITSNQETADLFIKQVDAAGVYHNCSTRFADGIRYGFGAEVGISTQKIPPRGPVGLEGLITYKYLLVGKGHLASMYRKSGGRAFTHRDLD